jgi:hypothetical protein
MKYTTPQLLNVTRASIAIMGAPKHQGSLDNPSDQFSIATYQSDE